MKSYAIFLIVMLLALLGTPSVFGAQTADLKDSVATDIESLFSVSIHKQPENGSVHYIVTVTASAEKIAVKTTAVVAHVKNSVGDSRLYTLKLENIPASNQAQWQLDIPANKEARYVIMLRVNSATPNGARIVGELPSQFFTYPDDDDLTVYAKDDELTKLREQVAIQVSTGIAEKEVSLDLGDKEQSSVIDVSMGNKEGEPEGSESSEASRPWALIAGAGVGVLAFLALLFFGYKRLAARRQAKLLEGLDESEASDDSKSTDEAPGKNEKNKEKDKPESEQENSIDISDDDPMSELDAAFDIKTEPEPESEVEVEVEVEVESEQSSDMEVEVEEDHLEIEIGTEDEIENAKEKSTEEKPKEPKNE